MVVWRGLGCAVVVALAAAGSPAEEAVRGLKTAVTVFAGDDETRPFLQTVQSRMEKALLENGAQPLDEAKARELKDVWKRLEDPAYFVTAEEFVEAAEKYDIQRLARVYVQADVEPGLADYFCATAQADVRFVDADARVLADVSAPMGAPGSPPSDGLTRDGAVVNALHRALDEVCIKLGLEIADPVQPQAIRLQLVGPLTNAAAEIVARAADALSPDAMNLAALEQETWRTERDTCGAQDPSGNLGAVGATTQDTDFRRTPPRLFGSRIHLLDLRNRREIGQLPCHELGYGQAGPCDVSDCMFLTSWRYLAAATGRSLFLWDVERGRLMSLVDFDSPLKGASLVLGKDPDGRRYVGVEQNAGGPVWFRIERARHHEKEVTDQDAPLEEDVNDVSTTQSP